MRRLEAPSRRCGHCEADLTGSRRHARYCSDLCRATASRERREGPRPTRPTRPTPVRPEARVRPEDGAGLLALQVLHAAVEELTRELASQRERLDDRIGDSDTQIRDLARQIGELGEQVDRLSALSQQMTGLLGVVIR